MREELVFRARQAQILAQGLALVFAAEDAAALQRRDNAVVEAAEMPQHPPTRKKKVVPV